MVIMKDILANIAKAIVENPDDVVVSEREENGHCLPRAFGKREPIWAK